MKKLIALLALFACVCLVGAASAGGHCTIRSSAVYGYQNYAQATYVEPVVVAQYVAVPLAVPTFSITYGAYGSVPGQAGASIGAQDSEVAKLRADVDALGKKLDQAMQFVVQQPQPKNPPTVPAKDAPKSDALKASTGKARPELAKHPGVGVLNKSCASCHEAKKADEFGGGIVLAQGKDFVGISAETSKAVVRALLHGKMPKGAPRLSDEDSTSLIDLVTQP